MVKSILILSNSFIGLYSFRKEVIQAIINKGYLVFISCPVDDPIKAKWFEDIGCTIIETVFNRKGTNPFSDIKLVFRYRSIIKQVAPLAVLSYTIKPNLYGGIACQLRCVPQIANVTGLGSAVENPGWLQHLTIQLYKIGLKNAKMVFLQNQANLAFCQRHSMIRGNRALIPGSGVNLTYHSFQEYPQESIIKFIFISRLLREKGIEEYLRAATIIKRLYPNTEFHIVGPCEEAYNQQLAQFQDAGVVIYHGLQSDVRPFIGSVHCTVHPSYYSEGMSNVLLESCAAGRPIITTNRPGCGEIVEDGKTGFLVKERDVDDLVRILKRFMALSHEEKALMGRMARKKVEREFDRNIVVKAYLDELETL